MTQPPQDEMQLARAAFQDQRDAAALAQITAAADGSLPLATDQLEELFLGLLGPYNTAEAAGELLPVLTVRSEQGSEFYEQVQVWSQIQEALRQNNNEPVEFSGVLASLLEMASDIPDVRAVDLADRLGVDLEQPLMPSMMDNPAAQEAAEAARIGADPAATLAGVVSIIQLGSGPVGGPSAVTSLDAYRASPSRGQSPHRGRSR